MARGIDLEAVTPRFASKSIGCCKKFPGRNSIKGIATLTHWLTELGKEIVERLEKDEIENNRVAKQIVVSFTQQFPGEEVASTRCVPLHHVDVEVIVQDALDVIKRNTEVFFKNEQNTVILNPITLLGISAGKFEDHVQQKKNSIKDLFSKAILNETAKKSEVEAKEHIQSEEPTPMNSGTDARSPNIKSFFSVAKESAKEKEQRDEHQTETPVNDDSNCDNNSAVASESEPLQYTKPMEMENASSDCGSGDKTETSNYPVVEDNEVPGPSNQTGYMATYAEYLRPEIPDDFYEICTQCKKKLLTIEMQSHLDMHLAFQLSEEQRMEFRSQLKVKSSSSSSPVAKKPKLDRSSSTNLNASGSSGSSGKASRNIDSNGGSRAAGSLTKYFAQKTDEVPESSVRCDECGKFIQIDSVAEHSDYHTAKKLQMEFNLSSVGGAVLGASSNKSVKSRNRTDSTSKKRSIASFFKTTS